MLTFLVFSLAMAGAGSQDSSAFDDFFWISGEVLGEANPKAAIVVRLEIPGAQRDLYGQLDTGSDATIFYGNMLRRHGVDVDSSGAVPLRFRWYGHGSEAGPLETPAFIDWQRDSDVNLRSDDPADHIVGSIGLDKVVGKILVLDFLRSRYAVVSDTLAVRHLVPRPVGYVDAQIAYNKFFVSVEMGPDTIQAVRYDSGASAFALVLPRDWWEWATGLSGAERGVEKDTVASWGKGLEAWTAPAKYPMKFGPVIIRAPRVTYIAWPDASMAGMRLMGNALFYDNHVVVLDCIRHKFGVSGPVRAWDRD